MSEDDFSNPLARKKPLGGRTGVAIVSLVPIIALILFFVFGFFVHGWSWSWIFFLAIPVAAILVYGPGGRDNNR
jgi:MFS family permease